MERRRSKRKKIRLEAEIVLEDTTYAVITESISEHGINLETSSRYPLSTSTRFNPGTEFEVKFRTPAGEVIKLHCKVMWSFKASPDGLKRKVGLEIIFPPPAYVDFYNDPQQF